MRQRILTLLRGQATRILALEAELDGFLYPPEGHADDDGIRTAAGAVAFITKVTNNWKAKK